LTLPGVNNEITVTINFDKLTVMSIYLCGY